MLYLFDLDGTLIDSELGIVGSMRYAFAQMALEPPPQEVLRTWIGPPLRTSFPTVLGPDPALTETAVAHYRTRFEREGWAEHVVYAGIAELIASLQAAGHRLAVVTTKLQTQAQRIVDHLPFGRAFTHVYGPGGAGRAGTAAAPINGTGAHAGKVEMIALALSDFGVPAHDAVMIGDRHFDIEGARANAVRGIGVLWGFGSRGELLEAGATALAATPQELARLLL